MSLLLDAVSRAKQAQSQDPAMVVTLPGVRRRPRPWHWLWPLPALALGAGLGWWWQPTAAPVVAEVPHSGVALGPQVTLPSPVAMQPRPALEPVALEGLPVVAQREVAQPEATATPAAANSTPVAANGSAQPAPQQVSEPEVDPAVQRAFETALAQVGGELLPAMSEVEAVPTPEPQVMETVQVVADAELPEELEPLSFELQQALERAQQQVATQQARQRAGNVSGSEVPKLGQMPWAFQKQLPDLEVTAHVYASTPDKRWVRANGRELQEGDEAAPGLTISEILPNEIVLEMDQQRFRIPALGTL
ncbi:general secretion pathway protein GspB [Ferrimonas marina]|uniref:General secretion pathway protein B n=1 Tax=Ferrimonas marina TaxID=299255 RepID=A0A1M5ZFD7_9GAMM|nr:general secretion pathway protein GspB [Ferrimonas marina]SHI22904.1 general secretion pathway protein B [Ferrimonas marina]